MKTDAQKNIPTVLVIFGVTGDLVRKKIAPALFHLFGKGELPSLFKVIGFSRRNLEREAFHAELAEILKRHAHTPSKPDALQNFLNLFFYQQGVFENRAHYKNLAGLLQRIDKEWGVCSNKLFYLAVPPQIYKTIFTNLAASGLTKPCSPEEGWTRVIVEKPFGKDQRTAEHLDEMLAKLFQEVQIYRIDHYLAKEMLQNILTFRFSNNLFEQSWSGQHIERIEIRLLEKIGAEDRGSFYDGVGALRDVGQNHLLQMLALVTMDHPGSFSADAIRQKRAEALRTLTQLTRREVATGTFRAQYQGYKAITGVSPASETETYFKVRTLLSTSRWSRTPVMLEGGKRLGEPRKEIIVTFRHPTPCLCPGSSHYKNQLIIRLEPQEAITMRFWSKKPGLAFELEERKFEFLLRGERTGAQYVEEYEKLLLDCIAGDQTLFVSTDEIRAMWGFVDPIIKGWGEGLVPLATYTPDTDEPRRDSAAINEAVPLSPGGRREIGIVGLGKMGANIARRLKEHGWRVVGWNRTHEVTQELEKEGLIGVELLAGLIGKLSPPRVIWLMVPAGKPVDEVLFSQDGIARLLRKGDIVIDGGNSYYKDAIARHRKLARRGIGFLDVGVSGGPGGARHGASLMIGGIKNLFTELEHLFADIAVPNGYQFFEGVGAGHFVKMVHNGIEYGMMQALGEGFAILKKSKYRLDLGRVADIYNHGSVIESRLVGWLKEALELYGENLKSVSGSVAHTGEGSWTVKTAREMNLKAKIIEGALQFRVRSKKFPDYTGKILSALRGQFGGHAIRKNQ